MPPVYSDLEQMMYVKPHNQVPLDEKELKVEHTKVLRAERLSAAHNIIRFNFKDKVFVTDREWDRETDVAFSQEGLLLHPKSDDAIKQKEAFDEEKDNHAKAMEKSGGEDSTGGLRNQFNFTERTSMSMNNGMRSRETMTEPPPSVEYSAQATQFEMFDDYIADQERKREIAEKKAKKGKQGGDDGAKEKVKESEAGIIQSEAMKHAAKILERMVNLNTHEGIAQDFKFWEDASDLYREGEGTLLPLWKFYNERAKGKHVTAVRWNPLYPDLFAVGYGSYDFMKQGGGMIALYSLKNPSYPDYSWTTTSGVMCLDWHKGEGNESLLCAGLYDGSVAVYETRASTAGSTTNPIYQSKATAGKHTDPVWEVSWQQEGLVKELSFFSVSSDGRITFWVLSKSELEYNDRMKLHLVDTPAGESEGDGTSLFGLAGGCCFDFSPLVSHLFLVGTEEGKIHKCSRAYNAEYLNTFNGHTMAVYTVRWSTFNEDVFLSCSADWTIKLWDHSNSSPLLSFDLDNQVGDLAWTPWSSTSFAACTADGKVHVFDLNENMNEAICEQKVVRKAKLTKIDFNTEGDKTPVILVGDDHSCVSSLKLSPNLRWTAVTKAAADARAKAEAEAANSSGPRRGAPKKLEDSGEGKEEVPPRKQEQDKLAKIISTVVKH